MACCRRESACLASSLTTPYALPAFNKQGELGFAVPGRLLADPCTRLLQLQESAKHWGPSSIRIATSMFILVTAAAK